MWHVIVRALDGKSTRVCPAVDVEPVNHHGTAVLAPSFLNLEQVVNLLDSEALAEIVDFFFPASPVLRPTAVD